MGVLAKEDIEKAIKRKVESNKVYIDPSETVILMSLVDLLILLIL